MAVPAVLTVVEREIIVFRRLWRASVFSSVVTPVLFLAAMGLGLGGLVDDGRSSVDGLAYLDFVAPGLLAAGAVLSSSGEALWPVLGGVKWVRQFHAMVSTPIRSRDVYWGTLAWIALRTTMSSSIFLLVAVLFGAVSSPWAPVAVPAAVLGGLAMAAPLASFSVTQDSDLPFAVIMRLGVLPLFLFSGTFFPISQLPAAVQPLAWLSPLWHAVQIARAATTGSLDAVSVAGHVAVLVAMVVAGGMIGTRNFARRLSS